jgi:D-alanyl-lipoteichoic acid acyltransferase DltB (MBOAT superfamily)
MNWSNFRENLLDLFVYNPKAPLLFNSGTFMLLFLFFMVIYIFIHKRRLAVSLFVIVFSLFFYYKSSGIYFLILVFTAITDYSFALLIDREQRVKMKKLWLFLAMSISLSILAFFKYTNFFLQNLVDIVKFFGDFPIVVKYISSQPPFFQKSFQEIVQGNFQPLDIFLPIGISFYTFQSISYVLDVYWKKIEPTTNFLDYSFFLAFFPQLVAGPIVKANLFLPQLKKDIHIDKKEVYAGMWLIMIGLIKKAVIADYISQYNDLVFASPGSYSGFENLMAVYGYTLQIYLDFSGYSDMAIGLGKMMGFDLGINFDLPYQSKNITEFWRRWHISLSSWLRDYVYIPLGGNRKGSLFTYRNLMLTMLIGGLWHGADWKFVFWGALHGIGLAVHKLLKPYLDKIPDNALSKFTSWFITFHFVIFLWIYFRAQSFEMASLVIKQIATAMNWAYLAPFVQVRSTWLYLMLIGFAMHVPKSSFNLKIQNQYIKMHYLMKTFVFILIIQLVLQFKLEDVQPFIYFQF